MLCGQRSALSLDQCWQQNPVPVGLLHSLLNFTWKELPSLLLYSGIQQEGGDDVPLHAYASTLWMCAVIAACLAAVFSVAEGNGLYR